MLIEPFTEEEFLKINNNNSKKDFREYINDVKEREDEFFESIKNKEY